MIIEPPHERRRLVLDPGGHPLPSGSLSLNSSLYFFGAATTLILPGMKASTRPGAIHASLTRIRADRVIYTIITLLCVLIIYDGWEQLQFWNVVAVILGPSLAVFMSHIFGATLGMRVAQGRPLTRPERWTVFVEECRFVLVAVPPLVILVVLAVAGVSYSRIIQVIVLVGVMSLGVWGGVAGRRAGLKGGALLLSIGYACWSGVSFSGCKRFYNPDRHPFVPESMGIPNMFDEPGIR